MRLKMILDFLLEVIRILKPDQRKWIVRIFIVAGISSISSKLWVPWIEAYLKKEFSLDLSYSSLPGWIFITIGIFFHIFNRWQVKEAKKEPMFREKHDYLSFSLGGGATCRYSNEQLRKQANYPFDLGGHIPIKVYVEGKKLYADVEIFGGSGLPPIKIRRNVLSDLPHNWDSNKSENALEIVDENRVPAYQLIYKRDDHIILNGIFPFPGGLVLADNKEMVVNPCLPVKLELKRIFKYPSWKYPAVYET